MQEGGEHKPKPKHRVHELHDLTRSGRLRMGSVLVHRDRHGNKTAEAVVVANGLRLNDTVYPSMSTAARAVAKHSVNGWKFWRLESGELVYALRMQT